MRLGIHSTQGHSERFFAALLRNKMLRLLPLDSSLRWNDAGDMPVIPGEHRETRNPGASSFCLHA